MGAIRILDALSDDETFRFGEWVLLIGGNVLFFISVALTDYESNFWIFNNVDPLFLWWYVWNMAFLTFSATRSRVSRVSYTQVSSNMHCGVTDQYSADINFITDSPGDAFRDVKEPTIYDSYGVYVKGTSFPKVSHKRVLIIAPKSLIGKWYGYVVCMCLLNRYVGQDHKSLPPHVTEALQRMDKRKVKFRFGGTTVWFGNSADKWVAHWKEGGVEAKDGNKYHWVVGGRASIPYSQAKEESDNRTIHDLRAHREEKERQYEGITGRPYVEDKQEES